MENNHLANSRMTKYKIDPFKNRNWEARKEGKKIISYNFGSFYFNIYYIILLQKKNLLYRWQVILLLIKFI